MGIITSIMLTTIINSSFLSIPDYCDLTEVQRAQEQTLNRPKNISGLIKNVILKNENYYAVIIMHNSQIICGTGAYIQISKSSAQNLKVGQKIKWNISPTNFTIEKPNDFIIAYAVWGKSKEIVKEEMVIGAQKFCTSVYPVHITIADSDLMLFYSTSSIEIAREKFLKVANNISRVNREEGNNKCLEEIKKIKL